MRKRSAKIVAIALLSLISISSAFGYSYLSSNSTDASLDATYQPPTVSIPTEDTSSDKPYSPTTPAIDKNVYPLSATALNSPLFSHSQHVGGSGDDEVMEVIDGGEYLFAIGQSDSADKDICRDTRSVYIAKALKSDLTLVECVSVSTDQTKYLGATVVSDGIVLLTSTDSGIRATKYSYSLVYLDSVYLNVGNMDDADVYLVDEDVYMICSREESVYMTKINSTLSIEYCRLISSEGAYVGSLLSPSGMILALNTSDGVSIINISNTSNILSTSYIKRGSAIDVCPSLDSTVGAYMLLYTVDNSLRVRLLDTSLIAVYDKAVSMGSSGKILPISRGYLIVSYDTSLSTLVCKHGDVLREDAGIYADGDLTYSPTSDGILVACRRSSYVVIYAYLDDFEINYQITIPYGAPVYIDDTVLVVNTSLDSSPYLNGYGGIDGYIIKYG